MDSLAIYNALRTPPEGAMKKITGGRLKGMTDIEPMWRIKALTEQFGPCGFGWKYEITRQWLETGATGEISAFCNIKLYYKVAGEWSEGIPGTGGSAFIANERNGPYQSDECYKMALTDALSVACKALGMAADVYWGKDPTKYGRPDPAQDKATEPYLCSACGQAITGSIKKDGTPFPAEEIVAFSKQTFKRVLCPGCQRKLVEAQKARVKGSAQ